MANLPDTLPAAWRWSLGTWLAIRIVLTCLGLILTAANLIPMHSPYGDLYYGIEPVRSGWAGGLLGVWQRWDAVYYQHIAQVGYTDASLSAFFPLYPALGRLVGWLLGGHYLFALLVVSNVATILAFVVLHEVVAKNASARVTRLTVLAFAVFPAALYLYAPYAESLAVLLTLCAYQAARHHRWLLAGLAGIGAGLTQPAVVPLTVLLGGTVWQVWRKSRAAIQPGGILASLAPLFGLGLFLGWRAVVGFPSYTDVQQAWGWQIQWPWQSLAGILHMFTSGTFWIGGWINLIFLVLAVAALIDGIRHLPLELLLFQAASLLFLLVTVRDSSPLDSLGRHSLTIFPIYIALGRRLERSKPWLLIAASCLCLLYLSADYMRWR